MVHKNNFVVAIKASGKILKETPEILIPFNTEYSILLKNLESRKAVVSVSVDGKCVTKNRVIVQPNDSLELMGEKVHSTVKNRFKFIQKTKRISDYRGDRVDDGIVRVEVWFESKMQEYFNEPITYTNWDITPKWDYYKRTYDTTDNSLNYLNQTVHTGGSVNTSNYMNQLVGCTNNSECVIPTKVMSRVAEDGITVKGSDTEQNFIKGFTNTLEITSTVITLLLKGYNNNKPLTIPITVKTLKTCEVCGYRVPNCNLKKEKFCTECGNRIYF